MHDLSGEWIAHLRPIRNPCLLAFRAVALREGVIFHLHDATAFLAFNALTDATSA